MKIISDFVIKLTLFRSYRLVRSRTPGFHPGNSGSNPDGSTLMRILAIETSCDETAIASVEATGGLKNPRFKILKNLVASQIKIHRPFGGIVPTLAKREHLKNLPALLSKVKGQMSNIDLIAVTVGPGLEPALWTGINFAKEIYKEIKKLGNKEIRVIGVSHLEGHLYSNLLQITNYKLQTKNIFPAIALLVSGGHTILILMKDLTHYKKLGETRDDAVGEAFDKVARLLKLPYPGGPEIENLAKKGDAEAIVFPRPMLDQKNYDFSFSGLKTSVLYYLKGQNAEQYGTNAEKRGKIPYKSVSVPYNSVAKANVAASFQKAAFDVLISKTLRAAKEFSAKGGFASGGKIKSIMISGGVAANKTLANEFRKQLIKAKLPITQLLITKYPTDNAAMVAAAAYMSFLRKKKYKLTANGNLNL